MPSEVNTSRSELYTTLLQEAPFDVGYLYGYHSLSTQWNCSPSVKYRFGFEAEKECSNGQQIASRYQGDSEELLPHRYRAERDGSLGMSGFEIVSPVYDLTSDRYIEHLSTPVLSYLIHSDTSFRCGGHITISVTGKDQEWYSKKTAQIIPLLYALYPRRAKARGYARFFNVTDHNDRYNAVNLSNDKMEVRIFAGIKSLKQLKWRIDLLRVLFTTEEYEDLKWDTVYKDLLNIASPLGNQLHVMYGKKYGEKIMLSAAYHKAYLRQEIEWSEYHRVSRHIPAGVRDTMLVKPNKSPSNPNTSQLQLNVCDYNQERSTEA